MCMIDGDPQQNLTSFFCPREEKVEEEKKKEEEEEVSSYEYIVSSQDYTLLVV